jgi:thiol-disulfide isomerase/thioredoxin
MLTIVLQVALFTVAFFIVRPHISSMIADQLSPPPVPSQSVDYTWTLQDADGAPYAMEQLRGKVIVLNFWKPTCHACTAQLPTIQGLADAFAGEDVTFLCVAVEDNGELALEAADAGLSVPYYTYEGDIPDAYEIPSVPATLIIDRAGRVVMKHAGAAQWDDESVIQFIRGLVISQ